MKKRVFVALLAIAILFSVTSCSVPIISDFIQSEESLGKTNNTAVAIADAMEDYLKKKNKDNLALYGVDLALNSDGNGTVKLYYAENEAYKADYSDIYVAVVDSTTGHVSRFGKAEYAKDGLSPYQAVRNGDAFDAANLPIDSEKAVSLATRAFSNNLDFHYDYVQIHLSAQQSIESYEIRFISMLNDVVYYCRVDAVNGSILGSSTEVLE